MFDPFRDTGDDLLSLATSLCLVLDLIELTLRFRQSLFVLAEEAQVFNELAAGESRKDFEANVNADLLGRGFKRLWLNLAGEGDIPLARSRLADSAGLNVAFNPAVKMNGNVANLWIRNLATGATCPVSRKAPSIHAQGCCRHRGRRQASFPGRRLMPS